MLLNKISSSSAYNPLVCSDIYYPFGMQMDNRHGSENQGYKNGFQCQEVDDEVKGEGNSVNYKYRMHDPRIGRFFGKPVGKILCGFSDVYDTYLDNEQYGTFTAVANGTIRIVVSAIGEGVDAQTSNWGIVNFKTFS